LTGLNRSTIKPVKPAGSGSDSMVFKTLLEGDIGVNSLHGFYLKNQLTLHDLRTNVSYEHWFTLSYILFCFEFPSHGSLRDVLGCAQYVVPYCKTLVLVMKSSESSSDSNPLDSGSHILKYLGRWIDGLGFGLLAGLNRSTIKQVKPVSFGSGSPVFKTRVKIPYQFLACF
jgi:hypothetical protein